MKINLREACHMIELRTIPQGHHDYGSLSRNVQADKKGSSDVASGIKFVDLNT